MAEGNIQIHISDDMAARAWADKVMTVNNDFMTAMREASETLQSAKEFGEGTLVDEFYNMGTDLLNASQKVFESINEIASVVNKVLGFVTGFQDSVVNSIKDVIGKIFG